jgi:hypothetical protein
MLRLTGHFALSECEIYPVFGDAGNVRRIDETGAVFSSDHDSIEDVLFFDREDFLHLPNPLPITVVTRCSYRKRFICDWRARLIRHGGQPSRTYVRFEEPASDEKLGAVALA